jgi:hypothetical protein
MDANHPRKQKGQSQVLFQSLTIPVPTRCSSTVCTYWTDIDKMITLEGASYGNTAEDRYLRMLKQLSATHRPSLDNLPLDRPTSSDTSKPSPSDAAAVGDQTENTGRKIGRRYHRRADGGVDVEFVDVSAHQQHDHSTVSKVRPAIGTDTILHRNNELERNFEMHRSAIASPISPRQEDREARRSRWSQWHSSSKMRA